MVESTDVPVDLTGRVRCGLDLLEQTLPCPVCRPQPVPFVDRLPRPEPFRKIAPLHPGPNPVQNPVDHLPVIPPPATTPVTDRQERPQPLPLGITQVTPPHVHSNDPDMNRSHDRPDKPQVIDVSFGSAVRLRLGLVPLLWWRGG